MRGAHDPEFACRRAAMVRPRGSSSRGDQRVRVVGAEADFDDRAEFDILVADRGAARLRSPSAVSKLIVIVGPRSTSARKPSQPAITNATIGTAHTQGRPAHWLGSGAGGVVGDRARRVRAAQPRLPAAAASHISRGSKASAAIIVSTTTAAKLAIPGPGSIVVKRPELHQRGHDRHHKHVDVRPSADESIKR